MKKKNTSLLDTKKIIRGIDKMLSPRKRKLSRKDKEFLIEIRTKLQNEKRPFHIKKYLEQILFFIKYGSLIYFNFIHKE